MDPLTLALLSAANAISFVFHGLHFKAACSCDDSTERSEPDFDSNIPEKHAALIPHDGRKSKKTRGNGAPTVVA